jgi:hypothetical protein
MSKPFLAHSFEQDICLGCCFHFSLQEVPSFVVSDQDPKAVRYVFLEELE